MFVNLSGHVLYLLMQGR